jgi:hypothetical protein
MEAAVSYRMLIATYTITRLCNLEDHSLSSDHCGICLDDCIARVSMDTCHVRSVRLVDMSSPRSFLLKCAMLCVYTTQAIFESLYLHGILVQS